MGGYGGYDFDRESFTRTAQPEQKPRPRSSVSIPGSLILLVLLAGIGFAGYQLLKTSENRGAPANSPDLRQIEQRLDVLEKRVERLDARRSAPRTARATAAAQDDSVNVDFRPASSHALRVPSVPLSLSPDVLLSAPSPSGSTSPTLAKPSLAGAAPNRSDPRPNASSTQEEWEATANRLGDVVGELATQRNEIDRTQESLGQLSERLGRNSTSFSLRKGAKPQNVGPVRLRLLSTDPKGARYTMRLMVGDDSIELKDRALHEVIQFYASGGAISFDLVVSEIRRDGVTGKLSLPKRS